MIAVRVLQRGRVVREAIFPDLPVTFGRGPGNTLVLSDPSVSREHARVEAGENGPPRLVDLGSRNGLGVGRRMVQEIALDRRVVCRVGRVSVEIEPVSEAPTLELDAREWRRFERRRALLHPLFYLAAGVCGMVVGGVVQPSFWSPWDHTRWSGLAALAIGGAVMIPFLAGILFVVLKAAGRPVRMVDTMRAFSLLVWLNPAGTLLRLGAYYVLSSSALAWLDTVASALVFTAVVVTAASVRRERSTRFMLAWTGGTLLLIVAMGAAWSASKKEQGQPNIDLHAQAPLAGFAGRAESLEEYLGSVRSAAAEAERAAKGKGALSSDR
jgi:hypothetical protein